MKTPGTKTKTIPYLHWAKNPDMHRRVLDGMRRFALTTGWSVESVEVDDLSPGALRERVCDAGVIGCVRAAGQPFPRGAAAPPGVPTVLVDPVSADRSRRAGAVFCDNAAIAQAAFRELSAGHPPSYAAVSYWDPAQRWAKERIAAFRALCAEAGRECAVFRQPRSGESPEARMARLAEWAAALPAHVAIFAVNDFTAVETAIALHSRHRPIPRTATLVGVDGSPERHDIPPSPVPITSVNVNFESAGFLAAKKLGEEISRRDAEAQRAGNVANVKVLPMPVSNVANSEHDRKLDLGTCNISTLATSPQGNAAERATFGPLMVVRRESTRGRGRREGYILEAAEAIRREACDGLSAAALAARFPVSRKHFERRFREAVGHSVLDEILNIRLESVTAYLLRRDVAIDAIAGLCGFGSEIELRRLFRRRFHCSMTEWRTRNST